MRKLDPIVIEFLWLIISVIGALLIIGFSFKWDFYSKTLDIYLYDTYFIFSPIIIFFPFLFVSTLLVFCIKEARKGFSRTFPDIIIFLAGIGFIVCLTNLSNEVVRLGTSFSGGWTAYPPLGGSPEGYPGERQENPFVSIITNGIIVVQCIVTIALLYISFRWGNTSKASS